MHDNVIEINNLTLPYCYNNFCISFPKNKVSIVNGQGHFSAAAITFNKGFTAHKQRARNHIISHFLCIHNFPVVLVDIKILKIFFDENTPPRENVKSFFTKFLAFPNLNVFFAFRKHKTHPQPLAPPIRQLRI